MKSLLVAAFSLVMITFSNVASAQNDSANIAETARAEAKTEKKEGFNVTETILEHIKDSHSWHLWGHTTVHLPVILYSDKGLEVFSASKLVNEEHEPVVYAGKYNYKLVDNKIKAVNTDGALDEAASKKLLDFSITKNVAAMFVSVALLLLLFLNAAKAYKTRGVKSAPKGLQSFLEPLILFVRDDIAKPNLGSKYAKYTPYLLTIFFFIWINNTLGLIPILPGGANLSGNIAFTMTLAVFTFFVVNFSGKKDYWSHIFWMPGVSVPIKIFLMPIEIIGVFVRPISLTIRLFANITAGHILVLSLICLIFIFKSVAASAVAVPFAVFISCIELLVAFLQAFIFTMLAALYIGMAIEDHSNHTAEGAHH